MSEILLHYWILNVLSDVGENLSKEIWFMSFEIEKYSEYVIDSVFVHLVLQLCYSHGSVLVVEVERGCTVLVQYTHVAELSRAGRLRKYLQELRGVGRKKYCVKDLH